MGSSAESNNKRRFVGSYLSTVISISLVLFMLGMIGLILLNAKKLSDYVKEHIGFSVIINSAVKEVDIVKLQKTLDATPFVRSTEHIDKDEAAEILKEDLGEDCVSFLGYKPLLSSIDVYLKAEYANTDSIQWIEKELIQNPKKKEVYYQKNLISLVNENVKKISLVLLTFSGLLLIIAIALINSSIRLSIYSKRFLIRSMQLVGAKQGFIRRPFIWSGILQGIVGAIIAIGLLIGLIYMAESEFPELVKGEDFELLLILFGTVTLTGILITWISTFLAVTKYLRIKPDKLY